MSELSCIELPPRVISSGLFNHDSPFKSAFSLMEIQIVLIFFVIHAVHFVLKPIGVPKLVSEIIAGILLGPTAIGHNDKYSVTLFNVPSQRIIRTLAIFGYTFFMFITGVKMDMGMIRKTGKKALAVGILALLCPLLVGVAFTAVLTKVLLQDSQNSKYLRYVATSHSLTPFPVIACLLSELKILNSELGRLALSSAIVSDLFSLSLTVASVLTEMGTAVKGPTTVIYMVAPIGFVLVVTYIFRPAMFWVVAQTPEGRSVKNVYLFAIILGVFFCGLFTSRIGQYVIFGAFIFGLAVPDGPPLGSALVEKLETIVSSFLMPIFITTSAMRADLSQINFMKSLTNANAILILVTFIAKIGATLVPPLYCKMPFNDALALAFIMSAEGTVNLATQTLLTDNGLLNDEIFALLLVNTTFVATIVPYLVKRLYKPSRKYAGYQKRNIMHCKPNAELRILACLHEQEGITAIISLLNASAPTKESPISIYILHLIELVGRATPIFISHDMQKRTISNRSYSENVILALNHYHRKSGDVASAHVFTAISPPKLMHEDICTLALNKLVFFMIIPFHRKFHVDGSLESENPNVRTLNCSVLDMAPCSVGILVDRGQLGRSVSQIFYVAIIFFGGNDDREALAIAKRMAASPNVNLTIAHFLPAEDDTSNEWESMLDDEAVKDIKRSTAGFEHVSYSQKVVKDGPETALLVRSMATQYDFIIVGRRNGIESPLTSGLTEWSEFPELGVVGDLLAASDLETNASVLVVQQQQKL